MLSKIVSMAVVGMAGYPAIVEVYLGRGLPAFSIVGLADTAIQESRERVRTAIANSEWDFPLHRITVNLAPADLKKEGPSFDLAISLGILAGMKVMHPSRLEGWAIAGELALDGSLRRVKGALAMALAARQHGITRMLLPRASAREAALVEGIEVYGVSSLREAAEFLKGERQLRQEEVEPAALLIGEEETEHPDYEDVKGQEFAKRAMEVAAAGGHNILLLGSPGSGKTMLAKRLPSIMPPLQWEDAIEVTSIYSVAGMLPQNRFLLTRRPYRSPHHTISDVGLVGGGHHLPKPGEITLSHKGVLFLDELLEFNKRALDVLRQPLEEGEVTVSRSLVSVTYPADFMLVAAANPCPCGYLGDKQRECICTPQKVAAYRRKLSGPLIDRIDIQVEVGKIKREEMLNGRGEPSEHIKARVQGARERQRERYLKEGFDLNSEIPSRRLRKYCTLEEGAKDFLERAIERMGISARGFDRILKVSRTIADLNGGGNKLGLDHVAEALQYRTLDRNGWMSG